MQSMRPQRPCSVRRRKNSAQCLRVRGQVRHTLRRLQSEGFGSLTTTGKKTRGASTPPAIDARHGQAPCSPPTCEQPPRQCNANRPKHPGLRYGVGVQHQHQAAPFQFRQISLSTPLEGSPAEYTKDQRTRDVSEAGNLKAEAGDSVHGALCG